MTATAQRWLAGLWLAALLGVAGMSGAWAQPGLVAVPPLSARVMDLTGTLDPAQRSALEAKLAAFEAEAGPQIVVLMLPATAPEDIADYTQRLGDAWQLGRREVGDGLLLVVAKDERRIRIAPAKALEGAVPDLAARQIIDRAITPAFRQGDYAGGLDAGVEALMARLRGESLPAPATGRGQAGLQLQELLIFFFVGVPVIGSVLTAMFGRKSGSLLTAGAAGGLGWWFTASLLAAVGVGIAALVLVGVLGVGGGGWGGGGRGSRGRDLPHIGGWGGGYGGSGRGGGWGGGGGFRSGGGGNFGGGGASGGW